MKVDLIIVTYNGMKWIEECLNSVLKSSVSVNLIVVDNNSTDCTVEFIKSNFEEVLLLEQKENLGFGWANNIGMSKSLKESADFVFLLNQDAFLMPDTLEKLIEVSQQNPDYGIISPIQLDYSGNFLENYFLRFMAKDSTRSFYSDFVLQKKIKKIYEIDFIQAAAWLLPISTIKKIGGFDSLFFHYGEDVNYCQRVRFHKLKVGVVPNVYIKHDATTHDEEIIKPFSKKYFSNYKKDLCVAYANLNIPYKRASIAKEKNHLYLAVFLNLVKFNFKNVFGFLKKIMILNQLHFKIDQSRIKNSKISSNYLND